MTTTQQTAIRTAYYLCQYCVSNCRWAGGDHTTTIDVGTPYATGETHAVWSRNRKWRGTNSTHKITVAHDWLETVHASGLAVVDGMLTLAAHPMPFRELRASEDVHSAVWVVQGRGVSLHTESGVLYRLSDLTYMHAPNLRAARVAAKRAEVAIGAERAQKARNASELASEFASLPREMVIRRSDIPAGVACASGIADWLAKRGKADATEMRAEDLLALALRTGDRVAFVRRIIRDAIAREASQ